MLRNVLRNAPLRNALYTMPRPRIYSTNASRQAAYRARKKAIEDEATSEWCAIVDAAWELRDAIHAAADAGDSNAIKLCGLKPSQILTKLTEHYLRSSGV